MPFEVRVPVVLAAEYASGAVTSVSTATGATTTLVSTGTGAIVGTATLVPAGGAAAAGTTVGAAGAATAGLVTAAAVAVPLVLVGAAAAVRYLRRPHATAGVPSGPGASSDERIVAEASAVVDDELTSLQDKPDDAVNSTSA